MLTHIDGRLTCAIGKHSLHAWIWRGNCGRKGIKVSSVDVQMLELDMEANDRAGMGRGIVDGGNHQRQPAARTAESTQRGIASSPFQSWTERMKNE